ncbi:MAG: bifunctional 5,10-methylene-tetrahydrofolate dehydrogenase/5,10-methylene-tetrahydrofolate cyclohydrolase [Bacteroidales bacterium]|nr:bifunctional 5,10-methylene-tetrahydrofolate dehydrogenase/5,10-methylene-tetrahydrofolate cyclohydrolase [Bacteroidales bacterium]
MELIDGKKVSEQIKTEIAEQVKQIVAKGGKKPHLAAVLVGTDGGSVTYVNHKVKACEQVGFTSTLLNFDDSISEEKLLNTVKELNENADIDGFIVQLPLPKHISEQKVLEAISPDKDVDGFHPVNFGKMSIGLSAFVSATPKGIVELLKRYKIETKGKHCVVLGRSNIVGRPVSILLSQKGLDCTVTVAHSRTENLNEICKQADILIAAIGSPGFVKKDMVKTGAVVIDVGTTRVDAPETKAGWRLKGDVNFDEVAPLCSYITPVPGGVGPMTIVSLLQNTLLASQKSIK